MILNIIFFVAMYPVLLIMYFVFRYMAKAEDGTLFGVKIVKKEWLKEPIIEEITKVYYKQLNWILMILLVVPLTSLFTRHISIQFTIWMLWLLVVIVMTSVPFALANKKMKAWKNGFYRQTEVEENEASMEDDDKYWYLGMFYYNPKDRKTMVNKRCGIGTTINMATKPGKILSVVSVVSLLAIPLCCVWLLVLEFTPIDLYIENQTLVAKQMKIDYEIPVSKIENLEVITELPEWSKVNGTGMDTLEKGVFDIRNQGKCKVFVNPQNSMFLKFTFEGTDYYVCDYDDAQTMEIYKELSME